MLFSPILRSSGNVIRFSHIRHRDPRNLTESRLGHESLSSTWNLPTQVGYCQYGPGNRTFLSRSAHTKVGRDVPRRSTVPRITLKTSDNRTSWKNKFRCEACTIEHVKVRSFGTFQGTIVSQSFRYFTRISAQSTNVIEPRARSLDLESSINRRAASPNCLAHSIDPVVPSIFIPDKSRLHTTRNLETAGKHKVFALYTETSVNIGVTHADSTGRSLTIGYSYYPTNSMTYFRDSMEDCGGAPLVFLRMK